MSNESEQPGRKGDAKAQLPGVIIRGSSVRTEPGTDPEDMERDAHESELVTKERAKELAEEAWVERSGRERGDLDLTNFQERVARDQFRRWWNINVDI